MKRRLAMAAAVPYFAVLAQPAASDLPCARCHEKIVARFRETSMAKALAPAAKADILRNHPALTFQNGDFQYRIVREGDRSILSVSGNGETLSAPLLWAFGRGEAGQTYVFERDGALYESRVSFFSGIGKLDLTLGAQGSSTMGLAEAAGRRMSPIGAKECFGCHSVGVVTGGPLQLDSLTPGVGCESCHGPTIRHVAAAAAMPKLGGRTAGEMAELCGRCHRTWEQIAMNGPRGVPNVRFQPYRLANSKCYDAADARISCTACHDPHGAPDTRAAVYDERCTACHSARSKTKMCKVAKADCVTCHMPKVELPGAHARFTDHQIRIVRAGDAYPN